MNAAAESVEGVTSNAAAPAVRESYSLKWFDWEPTVALSLPGAYGNTDFSNRGQAADPRTNGFLAFNAGVQLQFGEVGVSVVTDLLSYRFNGKDPLSLFPSQEPSLSLQLGRVHATAAYGFLGNQVVVGAGVRGAYAFLRTSDTSTAAAEADGAFVSMLGAGPQAGVIVKPDDVAFRVGATVRSAVSGGAVTRETVVGNAPDGSPVRTAGNLVLPDRITLPWEVEVGAAYQLGPRPLNPPWINPKDEERGLLAAVKERRAQRARDALEAIAAMHRDPLVDEAERQRRVEQLDREERMAEAIEDAELLDARQRLLLARRARYLNWPRPYVLLLASLLVTGASHSAVPVEGFLDQQRVLVGQRVSLSPRFAMEGEAIPNLMRVRAGTYFEPSRFANIPTRQHLTFGGDLRLITWDIFGLVQETTFRVSGFVDVAPRYSNFGIGIGAWH